MDTITVDFLKHGKNYVIISVIAKALSLLTIAILTRFISPSEFGILSVYNNFVTLLSIFMGLGLGGAISRYYYENKNDFKNALGSNAIFVNIFSILIAVIFLTQSKRLSAMIGISERALQFGIFSAFFFMMFQFLNSYLQATKQSDLLSKINISQTTSILFFTILIAFLLPDKKYYGAILAQVLVYACLYCFSLVRIKKDCASPYNVKTLKYSIPFGIPITFHLISGTILTSFDQIMINNLIGSYEAGIYSLAYKVGMIVQIVSISLNQAWVPTFYKLENSNQFNQVNILARKYSSIISTISIIMILNTSFLVHIFAPSNYHNSTHTGTIVIIITISYLINFYYLMFVNYAFFAKKTIIVSITTFIIGVLNICLNTYFIPLFGFKAAAWTTLFSYVLYSSILFLYVSRLFPQQERISFKNLISMSEILLISISIVVCLNTNNLLTNTIKFIIFILSIINMRNVLFRK